MHYVKLLECTFWPIYCWRTRAFAPRFAKIDFAIVWNGNRKYINGIHCRLMRTVYLPATTSPMPSFRRILANRQFHDDRPVSCVSQLLENEKKARLNVFANTANSSDCGCCCNTISRVYWLATSPGAHISLSQSTQHAIAPHSAHNNGDVVFRGSVRLHRFKKRSKNENWMRQPFD